MLKSVLLAGSFLLTSNFLPAHTGGVRTVVADDRPAAAVTRINIHVPIVPQVKKAAAWQASPDGLTDDEREFVIRINNERVTRGLNALTVDPLLVTVARSHSREMSERNYFDHHSPTPGLTTPMDRYLSYLHDAGADTPRYLLVGENIYYCSLFDSTYNVNYGHQALMNSPGHRANILEPRFARIGLGTYRDAAGQYWVTEMFLRDAQ